MLQRFVTYMWFLCTNIDGSDEPKSFTFDAVYDDDSKQRGITHYHTTTINQFDIHHDELHCVE
jgi:hypothetical protein